MALVIRKRVSLDFLGDEYKEAYINFKSIPVKDLSSILQEVSDAGEDAGKIITAFANIINKFFLDGKFPDESGVLQDIKKEDLNDLDSITIVNCFKILTGQDIDPKVG